MGAFARVACCAVVAVGMLFLTTSRLSALRHFIGLELKTAENPVVTLADEARKANELEKLRQAVFRRYEVRLAVVQAIVAGKISLLEGAAQFRNLALTSPWHNSERIRSRLNPANDGERYCRLVIAWARGFIPDEPGKAAPLAQLERQLQALARSRSSFQLPSAAVPPSELTVPRE